MSEVPDYGTRVYYEVIYWRTGFDPEDNLEYDHGDLARDMFSEEDDANEFADQHKRLGHNVRLHRVERIELPF